MRRALASTFAVLLLILGSGCATITKGSSQTVTVDTDPSGAVCTLTRDAKPLAVVNPTPGSVSIEKSSGVIAVICKKADYLDSAGTMASEFQAMTFGNILFGGLVGVVIDAASGATHEYPPLVRITLIPSVFATAVERDAFFDQMRQTLLKESAEVKERIQKECATSCAKRPAHECRPDCNAQLEAADAGTKAKLAEIDQKRALAKVREQ